MTKSIADLLAEPEVRQSRVVRVSLGRAEQYLPDVTSLAEERDALTDERETILARAIEEPKPMGASATPPRVSEIDARLTEVHARMAELNATMADYEGDVTVTKTLSDGEWAQWRIAHPARTEGEPGFREDVATTGGWCNSDDLIDDLGRYVTAWDGEELGEGHFDALGVIRPHKKRIASTVVGLYETGDGLGELRRGLSALLTSVSDSTSPSPSA